MEQTVALEEAADVVIYTCTLQNYDFDFDALEPTPNASMLRFTDSFGKAGSWISSPIPSPASEQPTNTLVNRMMKLQPKQFFPNSKIAIYLDGNIFVKSDLTPLIRQFEATEADIALFWHPCDRTLDEEIDYALQSRVPENQRDLALSQKERYRMLGLLQERVTENSIIFYRLTSKKLDNFCDLWWKETAIYAHRDQFSSAFALSRAGLKVHYWDWHFQLNPNPYFDRVPHRFGSRFQQLRMRVNYLGRYKTAYFVLSLFFYPPRTLRRFLSYMVHNAKRFLDNREDRNVGS